MMVITSVSLSLCFPLLTLLLPRFNKDSLFSIDTETGVIELSGELDRETSGTHDLVVRATDGGKHTAVLVTLVLVTFSDLHPALCSPKALLTI